jgi:hypothetical protein
MGGIRIRTYALCLSWWNPKTRKWAVEKARKDVSLEQLIKRRVCQPVRRCLWRYLARAAGIVRRLTLSAEASEASLILAYFPMGIGRGTHYMLRFL